MNNSVVKMWDEFKKACNIDCDEYEAWQFGGVPDELAKLVLEGKKVATASAFDLYAIEGEKLPKVGSYHVILNTKDEAVCIIKITRVSVVPFCDVTAEHAFKEGEGDRSLEYWRDCHRKFIGMELENAGIKFNEYTKIVCEEFEKVWPR